MNKVHHSVGLASLIINIWLILLIKAHNVQSTIQEDSWYQGCYMTNGTTLTAAARSVPDIIEGKFNPATCCHRCHQERYDYAMIKEEDSECWCVKSVLEWGIAEEANCSQRCDAVGLPCGGAEVGSVYKTAGPYLLRLSLSQSAPGETWVDRPAAFQLTVTFAALPGTPLGCPLTAGLDQQRLNITWQVDGEFKTEFTDVKDLTTTYSHKQKFTHAGNFSVDVTVTSAFLTLHTSILHEVILPAPSSVEIGLLEGDTSLPTCQPPRYSVPEKASRFHVFTSTNITLEASVAEGYNITFYWLFSDVAAGSDAHQSLRFSCEGSNCSNNIQEQEFKNEGVYRIEVYAWNHLGNVSTELYMVAVHKEVANLTLSLVDVSSNLITPMKTVNFLVSVVTTSRWHTTLWFHFGNNTIWKIPLQEKGGSKIQHEHSAGTSVELVEGYGESCTMKMKVSRVYTREGQFLPNTTVIMGRNKLNALLSKTLFVQYKIHGVSIDAREAVPTKTNTNFTAVIRVPSENMTFLWLLEQGNGGSEITRSTKVFYYNFPSVGCFHLSVKVSNRHGMVAANITFKSQDPVTGLKLKTLHPVVTVGDLVMCEATIVSGTNVQFKWLYDISEDEPRISSDKSSSRMNITYNHAGEYNITVIVANKVSNVSESLVRKISVQEPIGDVEFEEVMPIEVNSSKIFRSYASSGSHIRCNFTFSSDIVMVSSTEGSRNCSAEYIFPHPGVSTVNVTVYNNISHEQESIEVIVERPVGDLDILNKSALVTNSASEDKSSSVFVVLSQEKLADRDDLVYVWEVDGRQIKSSRVPVFSVSFTSPGWHNVSLRANNLVSSTEVEEQFYVLPSTTKPMLQHVCTVRLNATVNFIIKNVPHGHSTFSIQHGDRESKQFEYPNQESSLSWSHAYTRTGTYNMSVEIQMKQNKVEYILNSAISVQEEIKGFRVTGPTAIAVDWLAEKWSWKAQVEKGTALLYRWGFHGQERHLTTHSKFLRKVTEPGSYNLSVEVFNDISYKEWFAVVQVQYRIVALELSIPAVILGNPVIVTATVSGGLGLGFIIDYGDGNVVTYSTLDLREGMTCELIGKTEKNIPIHKLTFRHVFGDTGQYKVTVNVSNYVSSMKRWKFATVEDQIEGLEVRTDSPRNIRPMQVVSITAGVKRGNNLKFVWTFSDGRDPEDQKSSNKTSTVDHYFLWPGTYMVEVAVSNHLTNVPVVAKLAQDFVVMQPVRDLYANALVGPSRRPGNSSQLSDPIRVVASVSQGSDVKYTISFGDGVKKEKWPDNSIPFASNHISCDHQYTRVGIYNVSVEASNALNSEVAYLEEPITIQIRASDNLLIEPASASEFLRVYPVNLSINVPMGTNVTCDWSMGDQQDAIRVPVRSVDKTSSVTHRYNQVGTFIVTAVCWNMVSRETATKKVSIQSKLQSVELHADKQLIETGETVEFSLKHSPQTASATYYTWNFGDGVTDESTSPIIRHNYRKFGRFAAKVTAFHALLQTDVYDVIEIHVVNPIDKVTILCRGDAIVNNSLSYEARTFTGTSIRFRWNFGDGTIEETLNSNINHTFTKVGEYHVSVNATNPLSSVAASFKTFILRKKCTPPAITILGDPDRNVVTVRSQEMKIETEIKIDCDLTVATDYRWTIVNRTSNRPVTLSNVEDRLFKRQILYLPSRSLPYGNYSAILMAQMVNEIPYSTMSVDFVVMKSPLIGVIPGGILREASRHDSIVLDATSSVDPDFPDNRDFSYKWLCYVLGQPGQSCFVNSAALAEANKSRLVVSGTDLLVNYTRFSFNVTVSKPGRISGMASQVLQLQKMPLLEVSLDCVQCEDGYVNSNQRVMLKSSVLGNYRDDELHYEWLISTILDGNIDSYSRFPGDGHCAYSKKGVHWQSLYTSPNTTIKPRSTTTSTAAPSTTKSTAEPMANGRTSKGTTREPLGPPIGGIGGRPYDPQPGEGDGDPGSSPGGRPPFGLGPDPQEGDTGSNGRGRFPIDPVAGTPNPPDHVPIGGEVDPGTDGRDRRPSLPPYPTTPWPKVDPAVDREKPWRPNPSSVLDKPTIQYKPYPENTTTGLDKSVLVLKSGVLVQGRSYIANVTVTHKASGRRGSALVSFKVNQGPSRGDCRISHFKGVEMAQKFLVYCREWKDQETPIQYEVSYQQPESLTKDIIYKGFNWQIKFMLPAGSPAHDHEVTLFISILDSRGAKTECSRPIQVTPKEESEQEVEDILYSEVEGSNSTLQEYVQKGDSRKVRLYSQLVASRLNRLEEPQEGSKLFKRKQIRQSLLKTLSDLPLRDEYEVQQTTAVLVLSTAKVQELTISSLNHASKLLSRAVNHVKEMANGKKPVTDDTIQQAFQGMSNIITAATSMGDVDQVQDGGPAARTAPLSNIVTSSQSSLHDMLKMKLKQRAVGEEPIKLNSEQIAVYAGQFKKRQSLELDSKHCNFKLPQNMDGVLDESVVTKSEPQTQRDHVGGRDCYEVHAVTYKNNPYLQGGFGKVQSQVASLTLFSCEGEEMIVNNLTLDDHISMELPLDPPKVINRTELEKEEIHILYKEKMNIHQFNVTNENLQQALHIQFDFDVDAVGRRFPLALYLSHEVLPTPDKYKNIWRFPRTQEEIKLFLEPGTFNDTGIYYIGLVDAKMNAGRHRTGELKQREYSMRFWWTQCLYWDEQQNIWSGNGCFTKQSSTLNSTHCSCNHLTSFGAHLSLVPNDLNFVDVEDFFNLHENPVSVALVGALLVLYFILLVICIQLDRHDQKKGKLIHLVDNNENDNQKYIITVETGLRRNAGTTSKVSLILHGECGTSETRELLCDTGQPMFERNSRDTFLLTLPENLGRIYRVHLWHNNAGPSPNWYLSRICVKDVNEGLYHYFNCEKWLAVEEEDGKVEGEFVAMPYDVGIGFSAVLLAKGKQYLADYHLWFSLLTRPSHSRFTRCQRLSICLSLLMAYMAVSAAWYKQTEKEFRDEFGLLDTNLRSAIVGIVTNIPVLLVHFLIIMLFRRSKVSRETPEEATDMGCKGVQRAHSISSFDSAARMLQPAVTQSLFDQSILNLQNLQDWAQKQWAKHYSHLPDNTEKVGSEIKSQEPIVQVTGVKDVPAAKQAKPAPKETKQENKGVTTQVKVSPNSSTGKGETDQTSSGFEDTGTLSNNQSRTQLTSPRSPRPTANQPPTALPPVPPRVPSRTPSRTSSQKSPPSSHDGSVCSEDLRYSKDKRFFLPSCFRVLAWILTVLIILGCGGITILYGFRFGYTKSVQWVQSLFFSFLWCVFFTHPVIILVMAVYTAIVYRNDMRVFEHYYDGIVKNLNRKKKKKLDTINEEGESDDEMAKGIAARQRSRYLRFARPPHEKILTQSRNRMHKERKAFYIFNDATSCFVPFVLLVMVVYGQSSLTEFRFNDSLKSTFLRSGGIPYNDIQSLREWWNWTETEFVPTLFPEKETLLQQDNRIIIHNGVIIGNVILRQLRVQDQTCLLPANHSLHLQIRYCRRGYSKHSLETLPHGSNLTWRYWDPRRTKAVGIQGMDGSYEGGGYLIKLPKDRASVLSEMKHLKEKSWIDRYTRAIIIEFTVYHAPTNLVSTVTLLTEMPSSAGIIPQSRISSAYLYRYVTLLDDIILACELLTMICVLWKIRLTLIEIIKKRKQYLHHFWNVHLSGLCLVGLAYIGCYLYRFVVVSELVELFRATYYEEFIDISFLSFWDQIIRTLVSCMMFLVLVSFLKVIQHNKIFAKLSHVYCKASKEIIILGVMFLIWIAAYTSLGMLLFGSVSVNFGLPHNAILSVVAMMTRSYTFGHLEEENGVGTRLYVVSYLILATGTITAYGVAIMTFHYKVFRELHLVSLSVKETFIFLWNQFLLWSGLYRHMAEEEEEANLPAEFIMAEIEYQVEELLFKMNALSGTSNLPEKPPQYFTDSDCTYNTGDDGISSGCGSELRSFDEERFENRIQKIEENLYSHEPHLAQLIQLDNIGVDILSQEKEKQLRTQLELEIFRQLQVQRRDRSISSSDQHSGPSCQPNTTSSSQPSSGSDSRSDHTGSSGTMGTVLTSLPETDHTGTVSLSDVHPQALLLQNRQSESNSQHKDIPMIELEKVGKRLQDQLAQLGQISENMGAKPKTKTIPVKYRKTRDTLESSSSADSPPTPQHSGKSRPSSNPRKQKGSSSKHSSPEVRFGSRLGKMRSLRKTHSRGKGKGASLTPPDVFDDLGFDNEGFTTDSNSDGDGDEVTLSIPIEIWK